MEIILAPIASPCIFFLSLLNGATTELPGAVLPLTYNFDQFKKDWELGLFGLDALWTASSPHVSGLVIIFCLSKAGF